MPPIAAGGENPCQHQQHHVVRDGVLDAVLVWDAGWAVFPAELHQQTEQGAAETKLQGGTEVLPEGVAGRIRFEQGITSVEVDTDRFPLTNGIYESADFSSAQNRADILIQAGAGRVAVR